MKSNNSSYWLSIVYSFCARVFCPVQADKCRQSCIYEFFKNLHVCIRSIFSPRRGLSNQGPLKQPCKTQRVSLCLNLHNRLQSPESVQMNFVDIKCLQ